jgi:hypothetical protein
VIAGRPVSLERSSVSRIAVDSQPIIAGCRAFLSSIERIDRRARANTRYLRRSREVVSFLNQLGAVARKGQEAKA